MKFILTLFCFFLSLEAFAFAPEPNSETGKVFPIQANFSHHSQAKQQELLKSRTWQNFTKSKQNWVAIFDENSGLPEKAFGKPFAGNWSRGVDERNAEAVSWEFLRSIKDEFGLELSEFKFAVTNNWLGDYAVFYKQFVNGFEVLDSKMFVVLTADGKVARFGFLMGNDENFTTDFSLSAGEAEFFAPIGLVGFDAKKDRITLENEFVYVPIYQKDTNISGYKLAYSSLVPVSEHYGNWQTYIDANTGEILRRFNRVHFGTIDGQITGDTELVNPQSVPQAFPYKNLRMSINGNFVTTDFQGNFAYTTTTSGQQQISIPLQGTWVRVINSQNGNQTPTLNLTTATNNETVNANFDSGSSTFSERDGFFHTNVVHDFIKGIDQTFTGVDYSMNCNVELDGSCNAFWNGSSINFFRAGASGGGNQCPSISRIAGVVYHEYGHGINSTQYNPFGMPGDMHEGIADYTAATIENQPLVGVGFNGPNSFLRNVNNENKYPEDIVNEVHFDGLIIAGALWDLRQLIPVSRADSLHHFARYGKAVSFFDYFVDLITSDDNDGDLTNGTPYSGEIFEAFGKHKISSDIEITHDKISDTEDSQNPYNFTADFKTNIFGIGINASQSSVFYSIDGGVNFFSAPVTNLVSTIFEGQIPAQPSGTTVSYYLKAQDVLGLIVTEPKDPTAELLTFFVGSDQIKPELLVKVPFTNTIENTGLISQKSIVTVFDNLGLQGVNFPTGLVNYRVGVGNFQTNSITQISDTSFYAEIDLGNNFYQVGDVVEYFFTVSDAAQTPNIGRFPQDTNEFLTFTISNVETVDGFENGKAKWNLDAPWVIANQQSYSGDFSLDDSPGTGYDENSNFSATLLDGYNLSGYTSADKVKLTYWARHFLKIGQDDFLFVEISTDNWQNFTKVDTLLGASSWKQNIISLSPFVGNSDVKFRFRLVTDGIGNGPATNPFGVILDEIKLRVDGVIIYGDANENGILEESDADLVLESVTKNVNFVPEQKLVTDVDGDGFVRVNDASLILQKVKGLISKFPIE